jgi:hypothetical protein
VPANLEKSTWLNFIPCEDIELARIDAYQAWQNIRDSEARAHGPDKRRAKGERRRAARCLDVLAAEWKRRGNASCYGCRRRHIVGIGITCRCHFSTSVLNSGDVFDSMWCVDTEGRYYPRVWSLDDMRRLGLFKGRSRAS